MTFLIFILVSSFHFCLSFVDIIIIRALYNSVPWPSWDTALPPDFSLFMPLSHRSVNIYDAEVAGRPIAGGGAGGMQQEQVQVPVGSGNDNNNTNAAANAGSSNANSSGSGSGPLPDRPVNATRNRFITFSDGARALTGMLGGISGYHSINRDSDAHVLSAETQPYSMNANNNRGNNHSMIGSRNSTIANNNSVNNNISDSISPTSRTHRLGAGRINEGEEDEDERNTVDLESQRRMLSGGLERKGGDDDLIDITNQLSTGNSAGGVVVSNRQR